jgi:precorrin-6A/cobalt-precorrin-6A reductase
VKVLILGGTKEAHDLAIAAHDAGIETTTSLAGRTPSPRRPPGNLHVGGFKNLDLSPYDAIVDATHPFATRISAAAARTDLPLLRLERPGFQERPGDRWRRVHDVREAAAALQADRAFLTIGHAAGAFADTRAWCLIRAITPPPPPLPRRHELLLERPPFTLEHELALLERVETLVTKDSGGDTAKLDAARALGVAVILIRRPPATTATAVATAEAALAWIRTRATAPPRPRTPAR